VAVVISAGSATSVGCVRTINEDSVLITRCVFAIADGMGGHAAGDRASQIAVASLAPVGDTDVLDPEVLHQAIAQANADICDEAAERPDQAGMGTTLAGLAVIRMGGSPHWMVFNIGDSRVYAVEHDVLHQITVDHSEVQELVDTGKISRTQARRHPARNVVTRSLGTTPQPASDVWLLPVEASQTFLICSDGLTEELEDEVIAGIVSAWDDAGACAQALVDAADAAGGSDNSTVILLRTLAGDDTEGDTRPRSTVLEGLP
jgi:serine/threonine protein phosphatase PrpC